MARYREKSPEDMAWNRIRRRLTRELDTQIADWREEALNTLLSGAWDKYVASLTSGEKLELESEYKEWVDEALRREVVIEVASVAPVE